MAVQLTCSMNGSALGGSSSRAPRLGGLALQCPITGAFRGLQQQNVGACTHRWPCHGANASAWTHGQWPLPSLHGGPLSNWIKTLEERLYTDQHLDFAVRVVSDSQWSRLVIQDTLSIHGPHHHAVEFNLSLVRPHCITGAPASKQTSPPSSTDGGDVINIDSEGVCVPRNLDAIG